MKRTFRINDKGDEPEFEEAFLYELGETGVSASQYVRMILRRHLIQKSHRIPPIGPERRGRPRKGASRKGRRLDTATVSASEKKVQGSALFREGQGK